tara:strand:- start:11054 stop:11629 length:576 start_codon:yes stop_codon:yes gene_type:complete
MKITKRQLKVIVENYLFEQDALSDIIDEPEEASDTSQADAEVTDDNTGLKPIDDSESEEDSSDAPPEEEEKTEPESDFNKIKSFRLVTPDSPKEGHKIHFKKDSSSEKIIVFIDERKFTNPKTSDMVALAGAGLSIVEDENTKNCLLKIVQMDASFKGKNVKSAASIIKRKMQGSRFPFVNFKDVIRKALG